MMYWNGHMSTGGWIISILWTLIIFALIAGAIAWLVAELGGRNSKPADSSPQEGSAREILDRRLAKGELTVEQHRQLRDAIEGGGTPSGESLPSRAASAPG